MAALFGFGILARRPAELPYPESVRYRAATGGLADTDHVTNRPHARRALGFGALFPAFPRYGLPPFFCIFSPLCI